MTWVNRNMEVRIHQVRRHKPLVPGHGLQHVGWGQHMEPQYHQVPIEVAEVQNRSKPSVSFWDHKIGRVETT